MPPKLIKIIKNKQTVRAVNRKKEEKFRVVYEKIKKNEILFNRGHSSKLREDECPEVGVSKLREDECPEVGGGGALRIWLVISPIT